MEVRTQPTFLETLTSKYDFEPVKLPGLSRNGPLLSQNFKVSNGRSINKTIPVKINRCLFKIRTLNLGQLVFS